MGRQKGDYFIHDTKHYNQSRLNHVEMSFWRMQIIGTVEPLYNTVHYRRY